MASELFYSIASACVIVKILSRVSIFVQAEGFRLEGIQLLGTIRSICSRQTVTPNPEQVLERYQEVLRQQEYIIAKVSFSGFQTVVEFLAAFLLLANFLLIRRAVTRNLGALGQ